MLHRQALSRAATAEGTPAPPVGRLARVPAERGGALVETGDQGVRALGPARRVLRQALEDERLEILRHGMTEPLRGAHRPRGQVLVADLDHVRSGEDVL